MVAVTDAWLGVAAGRWRWAASDRWRRMGRCVRRGRWRVPRSSDEHARLELRRATALQRMAGACRGARRAVVDGARSVRPVRGVAIGAVRAGRGDARGAVRRAPRVRRAAVVRYWADLADDLLHRPPAPPRPSRLYASRVADTGELHLDGVLGPVDAEIVADELRRLSHEVRLEGTTQTARRRVSPRSRRREPPPRVRGARADGDPFGEHGRDVGAAVVPGDRRRSDRPAAVRARVRHRGAPERARRAHDDAVMETFLFDGPSVVIAKTHRRTFTGALRRAIQVRDRRCQHPSGCRIPASACDVDHIVPAAAGGPTSQFNGRAECVAHNRLADLHDCPPPLVDLPPERRIDRIDRLRARLRWRMLHEFADDLIDHDLVS